MLWTVAAPFFRIDTELRWLDDFIDDPAHHFLKIAADGGEPASWHRREGRATPAADWRRHWAQSARALDAGAGLITVFPQLALTAAIQRRYRGRGKPIIAWCFNLGRMPTGLPGRIAARLLRPIDLFVVHSRGELALLRDWLGGDERRVRFVPLQRAAIPRLAEEETGEPFAVALGSANRDYALLYEAARRTGLPMKLVAAGHALPAAPPPTNVTLLKGLDAQACLALAQRARLSIVPLADTGAASGQITVVEAMRMGRPIVATDTIGTRDYLTDDGTGLLVPPGDAAALAGAIDRLWADGALRARLGASAARYAAEALSDEAAAAALKAILDEFL